MAGEVSGSQHTLASLVALLGGELRGDGQCPVTQVATLQEAGTGEISFLANSKYRKYLGSTQASAVIMAPEMWEEGMTASAILTAKPYAYYARVAALLNPFHRAAPGISVSAVTESPIPSSCHIGPGAHIGPDVVLGERVEIGANAVIGPGVSIGADSIIRPGVVIYHGCQIGKRVTIHSNAVIGADGFGFAPDGGKWLKIPQIGRVIIGDDVEIGANTCIDRGTLADTVVGEGCKLDNQVHIAHNCQIGEHTVIAACAGIAGSTRIGHHCAIGGAAMISPHLEIAPGTEISPGTLVPKSIVKSGKYTGLYPMDAHDKWLQSAVQVRQLGQLAKRVSELEKLLEKQSSKG